MGTIPAPNIAEDVAQSSQNALSEYMRSRQLNQQAQLTQQQIQQAKIETQQKQQQLQDQQAMTKSMHDWDGQDINALPELMRKNGISAGGYMQAQQSILQRRQQLATLDKDQLDLMQKHHDYAIAQLDAGEQVPDEQLAQHISDTADQLQQRGHLAPNEAAAIKQHASSTPPDQLRPWLDVYKKGLTAESQQISQAKEQGAAAESNAKARKDVADAAHQELINKLATNTKPEDLDKQVDALVPPTDKNGQAQNQFVKAQVRAFMARGDIDGAKKAIDQAYTNQLGLQKDIAVQTNPQIQAGKVAVAGATAAARQKAQIGNFGEAGDPMIDMVGQNRVDLATALQRVPPVAKDKFLTNLAATYPEFQQQVYQTRQALLKSATSGDIGKNVTAFNTAISHAQQLRQAADALDNGDAPTLNKIGNAIGFQFGSDKTTNFNVIKNALAGEISKVFKGGEATDAEIKAVQEPFSAANSPAQLKGAIDNAIHLMNSKRDALKQQVEQGMQGKTNFGDENKPGDFFSKFGGKARAQ